MFAKMAKIILPTVLWEVSLCSVTSRTKKEMAFMSPLLEYGTNAMFPNVPPVGPCLLHM